MARSRRCGRTVTDFVLDASALVELAIGAAPADDLRRRVLVGRGAAPGLIDLEALQVLRRLRRDGVSPTVVDRAVRQARDAPVDRMAHRPLLGRIWELRDNVTAYDASYVALAERLDVPLLTCDARLGRSSGHRAEIIAYPSS